VADQQFFCIDRVVETARTETGFQPVVPHFKPSALAANRTAAAARMQSASNRGFHIAGLFGVRMASARLRRGVATLLTLSLPRRVSYRPD
jgi:hypothetical protein